MPEMSLFESAVTPASRRFDRRTVMKTAAWSVPVIAVAVATPMSAASTAPVDPASCVALPTGGFTVTGGNLVSDGALGTSPTTDGNFGTGWTPPKAPGGDAVSGYTQTDFAVAPTPASWWASGGDPQTQIGFLSLDDNDNRDGVSQTPSVVSNIYSVPVRGGTTYTFSLPIFASADFLGPQYLDISASGAGVSQPGIVQGYYGNPAIAIVPAGLGSYSHFSGSQTPTTTFTPSSDGTVVFTYTFTLAYVNAGARKNADLFVTAPALTACA